LSGTEQNTMPSRRRSIRPPSSARKPESNIIEIAPSISTATHHAKEQFWTGQASKMQTLVRSAGVKQQYRTEVTRLKRSLSGAQRERSRLQKLVKKGWAIFNNAVAELEQNPTHGKELVELQELVSRLRTSIASLTEQRDEFLSKFHAADGSLTKVMIE
jgi:hypothetical protein